MSSLANSQVVSFSQDFLQDDLTELVPSRSTTNEICVSDKLFDNSQKKLEGLSVVKKDGTYEPYNIEKVIIAVKKSAERMVVELSNDELDRICSLVNKHVLELNQKKDFKSLTSQGKQHKMKWGFFIPEEESELIQLAGIGIKTAKVVEAVIFEKATVAVDTHVHRVANRLWIVKTNEPLETSKEIEKVVPQNGKGLLIIV